MASESQRKPTVHFDGSSDKTSTSTSRLSNDVVKAEPAEIVTRQPKRRNRSVAWAVSLTASTDSLQVLEGRKTFILEREIFIDSDKGRAARFLLYAPKRPSFDHRGVGDVMGVAVDKNDTSNRIDSRARDPPNDDDDDNDPECILLQSEPLAVDSSPGEFTMHDANSGADVLRLVLSTSVCCFGGYMEKCTVFDATGRLIGQLERGWSPFRTSIRAVESNVGIFRVEGSKATSRAASSISSGGGRGGDAYAMKPAESASALEFEVTSGKMSSRVQGGPKNDPQFFKVGDHWTFKG